MRHLSFLARLLPLAALLGIPQAAAQPAAPQLPQGGTLPYVICQGLPGCQFGADNVFASAALPALTALLIRLVAGGAVVAIVIAGTELLLKASDEAATAAKKAVLYALGGLGLALAAGSIVLFVSNENYGQFNRADLLFGQGGILSSVIRIILILFNTAFIIVIIIAGIQMALSSGSADGFKRSGTMIKWAVVGAVLVNIAKVIIQAFLKLNL